MCPRRLGGFVPSPLPLFCVRPHESSPQRGVCLVDEGEGGGGEGGGGEGEGEGDAGLGEGGAGLGKGGIELGEDGVGLDALQGIKGRLA